MANSMANISRRLSLSFLGNTKIPQLSRSFCSGSNLSSSTHQESDSEDSTHLNSDADSVPDSSPPQFTQRREVYEQPLQNGLDVGIYKAILIGQVGQTPLQKKLRSGRTIAMFSLGTGGIRNNRRPFDNEQPREYANRCNVQWHRVSVYPERLGDLVMNNVTPGSIIYVEGNLETKVFTEPITGVPRRIREVAVRRDGRIVFLGSGGDSQQASSTELKGLGYFKA